MASEKGRPNYDSYSDQEAAHHATLRTPFGPKILTGTGAPPPVLGNPALQTSKNLGKQKGHKETHPHY